VSGGCWFDGLRLFRFLFFEVVGFAPWPAGLRVVVVLHRVKRVGDVCLLFDFLAFVLVVGVMSRWWCACFGGSKLLFFKGYGSLVCVFLLFCFGDEVADDYDLWWLSFKNLKGYV